MNTDSDTRLVTVAHYTSGPEANIAAGMLRANGIPCIIDGEVANQVFGIQLLPTPGITIKVYARDAETATELLRQ